jgi:hypothetical protein
MSSALPNAKSSPDPGEREAYRRAIERRGLVGLANDTKWDELIGAMRAREGWRPRFRYKCIDGIPSPWDREWSYHLPFPTISAEWLDLEYLEEVRLGRLPPQVEVIDHSAWMVTLLQQIGLDFRKGRKMIRIFGYGPRSLELFDE